MITGIIARPERVRAGIFICLLAVLLGGSSCNNNSKSKLPAYVLDQETMAGIITDMHLIEAILAQKQISGELVLDSAQVYYDSLFATYDIQRKHLDSSFVYYGSHPELLDAIYTQVITRLSKKEVQSIEKEKSSDADGESPG